jgi:hypothetical protein
MLDASKTSIWASFRLFGMIAQRPAFLKAMLPVFSWGKIIGISTHVNVGPCSQYKPELTYAEGEWRAR